MNTSPLHLPRTALCTAAFIFFASFAAAQSGKRLHVVSNRADVAGKFSSITEALATVADGDTLYVIGSPTSYGKITITKPVVIVGDGFGESNPNKPPTTLDSVNFAVSGSTISNCKLGDVTAYGASDKFIEYITLNRNDITGEIEVADVSRWTIYHNVLRGRLFLNGGTSTVSNMIFDHNIIFRTEIIGLQGAFITFNHLINSRLSRVNSSQIENNIFYWPPTTFLVQNQGKDNQVGIDLRFIKFADPNSLDFNFKDDYHLAPDSPAKGKGTDGTDPGIYGGSRPFPSWDTIGDLYPFPPRPSVLELTPYNNRVKRGDRLELRVKLTPTPTKEN